MTETTRMITIVSATKAMSKKEGVGLQWEIKASIDGVSGNFPTLFFATLSQIPGDDPYKGLSLCCTFSRGNLKLGKTGQYQDNYYWDLVDWNTTADITPLPSLDQGAGGQSHTAESSQAPQNKQEAGEQMQGKPQYEGWQIGQSYNLAVAYVGPFNDIGEWWLTVEQAAAFILPRLGKEPMASQPPADALPADSNAIAPEGASETPEYIPNVTYNPNGDRIFPDIKDFAWAVENELHMTREQAREILQLPEGEHIQWQDPTVWRTLEASSADGQKDLPW